jgi:hypothetical protein
MAKQESHVPLPPRFTWRTLAGLFDEAWHHGRRRQRRWLVGLVSLTAAGVLIVAHSGAGGNRPTEPGASVALTHKTASDNDAGRDPLAMTGLTFITPAADKPIPVGRAKTLKIRLVDRSTKPVERAGVPVYLTQLMYRTTGVTHAWATINGQRVGRSAIAFTDPRGVATFAVTGTKASSIPTTFDASLRDQARRVYGASGYLMVRFSAAPH